MSHAASNSHPAFYIFILFSVTLWFVNITSVKSAARLQIVFTTAKVVALLLIISGGISVYLTKSSTNLNVTFEGSKFDFGDLAGAFYSGMWAYAGW